MSHLYQRRGHWYVKYYQDGKPKYKSLKTKSKSRARSIQREIDQKIDEGIIPIPEKGKDIEVDTFWDKYMEWGDPPPFFGPPRKLGSRLRFRKGAVIIA